MEVTSSYCIKGPGQKRPSNWQGTFKNTSFKKTLIAFLTNIWKEDTFATVLRDKVLYANLDNICFVYCVLSGSMIVEEVEHLYSSHEEADSHMFFHAHQCEVPSKIVIRTDDTDCLVIALGCKHNLDPRVSIWLEIGKKSRNDQRYININQLHQHLGAKICCALPAYHALTGCDYTSSFMKKRKVKPFKLLQKNEAVQDALIALGETNSLEQDNTEVLEKYVCQLYGQKKFQMSMMVGYICFFKSINGKKTQSD